MASSSRGVAIASHSAVPRAAWRSAGPERCGAEYSEFVLHGFYNLHERYATLAAWSPAMTAQPSITVLGLRRRAARCD